MGVTVSSTGAAPSVVALTESWYDVMEHDLGVDADSLYVPGLWGLTKGGND